MGAPAASADPGHVALGDSRARVLAVLQEAGAPLAVPDVAGRVGLHPNTARFHLDALVDAGLAERAAEDRDQPGRPRTLYAARPGAAQAGRRSYRLLAEVLTGAFAERSAQPAVEARDVGEVWGRHLVPPTRPFHRADAVEATARLVGALDDMGFLPEVDADVVDAVPADAVPADAGAGGAGTIRMHRCPFREVAEQHPEVVCSLHLGLMRGFLAELGGPLEADRLEPFVEPSLCVAHLAPRGATDASMD